MVAPLTFLKETREELRKVVWPTRSDVIRLTFIVLTISAVVGFYVGGIDLALTKITEAIIK